MARQLWLLRHADAEPHGARPDSERRLTGRGERQARLAGAAIARMGVEFDALLSSPKERALRTATVAVGALSAAQGEKRAVHAPLAEGFDARGVTVHAPLAEGFNARGVLDALVDAALGENGRLLLVGHEPDLSSVVAELTGARIDLKKGGLAVVRMDENSTHPGGELVALLRPAELTLIAGGDRCRATPAR
jgi:phosphohistidine phosphatase